MSASLKKSDKSDMLKERTELEGPTTGSQPGRYWRVRCRVTKKNGEQCKNWAIRGGFVCRVPQHGSGLPSVRRKAQERLSHLSELSIEELHYMLLPTTETRLRARAALATIRMLGLTSKGTTVSLREEDAGKVDDLIAKLKKGEANV